MAKPYSQDLRDRVIDAVEKGKLSCLKTEPTLYRGEPGLAVERRHAADIAPQGSLTRALRVA
jgi:hypothetical protein